MCFHAPHYAQDLSLFALSLLILLYLHSVLAWLKFRYFSDMPAPNYIQICWERSRTRAKVIGILAVILNVLLLIFPLLSIFSVVPNFLYTTELAFLVLEIFDMALMCYTTVHLIRALPKLAPEARWINSLNATIPRRHKD
jgi:hypothetical protein